ncbi:small secreted protein [Streptomyces sp. NPDC088725]|uniref:small secreted protein n=1 Tax=Streptomyces sp. NPDC088725 TaxID=3365873 RepID=UPI00382E0662
MNKKLAAALSGGAVMVIALSGCSDDSDSKVNDWAKQVCDKVQPQRKKITDAGASIQNATSDHDTPTDVQKIDSAAFQSMSDAYKALGSAVDSAGPPPVDGGAKTQQAAVRELDDTSVAYGRLVKKVDALDTKNQSKFADGLSDVANELATLSKSGDKALKALQSGEVGKAMAQQPGCQLPSPSAGAASASPVT